MFWYPSTNKTPQNVVEKTLGEGSTSWLLEAVGTQTASGIRVTPTTAVRDPRVLAAVIVLGQDVAKVPIFLKQDMGDTIKAVTGHSLYRIFRRKPNNWMTPFEMMEWIIWCLALAGNAYFFKVRDSQRNIIGLIPIQANRIQILESPDGEIFYQISRGGTFENKQIPANTFPDTEIWHIKNLPLGSGLKGASCITHAANTIGLSLAQQEQASGLAKNGAKLGGILKYPGKLKPETKRILKQQWNESYSSSAKAGQTAILERGMEFQQITMSMVDAEFIEQQKLGITDIYRIFRVNPTKMMDMSRATYSNVEQENLAHATDALIPYMERIESSANTHLLTDEEAEKGLFFEFDVERLLRGDTKTRTDAETKDIQWGIRSRNEVRRLRGLNPYDTGEVQLLPANMIAASKIEEVGVPNTNGAPSISEVPQNEEPNQ